MSGPNVMINHMNIDGDDDFVVNDIIDVYFIFFILFYFIVLIFID